MIHHHLTTELSGGGSGTWNPLSATAAAENWPIPGPAAAAAPPPIFHPNNHMNLLHHHLHDHSIDCSNYTSGSKQQLLQSHRKQLQLADWNEAGAPSIRIRSHHAAADLPPDAAALYGHLREDSNGDHNDATAQEEAFRSRVYKHGQECCSVDASVGLHHHRHVLNSAQQTGGAVIHDPVDTASVGPGLPTISSHQATVSESSQSAVLTYDVSQQQGFDTSLMNGDIRRYIAMSITAEGDRVLSRGRRQLNMMMSDDGAEEDELIRLGGYGGSSSDGRQQQLQQLELQDLLSLYRRSGNMLFPAAPGSSAASSGENSSNGGSSWAAPPAVLGLNLGGRTYFAAEADWRVMKRRRPLEHPNATFVHPMLPPPPLCQVDGCPQDLSTAKHYHRRHKVCEYHSKSATVYIAHQKQRFCQQCSRFHALAEFDDGKRSCRRRLADHNRRRRKHVTTGGSGSVDEEAGEKGNVASGNEGDGGRSEEAGEEEQKCGGEDDDKS